MTSTCSTLALRLCLGLTALVLPSIGAGHSVSWLGASALAQAPGVSEKEAFEAAKALGTVEAWDAFLNSYSSGFHADLARAYVKKLAEQTPPAAPAPAAAPPATAVNMDFPIEAGSWGGIVRNGPGQGYARQDSLEEGETVSLMGVAPDLDNGFPWFKIWYGPEGSKKGYMWGGILCAKGVERPDVYKLCPPKAAYVEPRRQDEEPRRVSREPKGCGSSYVSIDGRCVLKRDASTHCGPGYRLQGNTCVQGYQPPKPQKQLPSWQVEAIKKGCKKGMGWNPQEGCHEND